MNIVIVGAGHAGVQAVCSLREEGFEGDITLISSENHLPVQKPPLSKGYLTGKQTAENLLFRNAQYFVEQRIKLMYEEEVTKISLMPQIVTTRTNKILPYDKLILATGASNRTLDLGEKINAKTCYLRDLKDAQLLQTKLQTAQSVAVVGGGFIGLEIAAAAVEMGKSVTVYEAGQRLMQRVLPTILSDFFLEKHKKQGVTVHLQTIPQPADLAQTDLVVVGIGVLPNQSLAQEAGLDCNNGIVVNQYQQTSHPNIYAIGDCANHFNVFAQKWLRLESVQNANDQAKTAIAHLLNRLMPYQAVPWFWTNQYDIKLQMAGISEGHDRYEVKGEVESGKFSVYYYINDKLIAVDSVNKPADHIQARKNLANFS